MIPVRCRIVACATLAMLAACAPAHAQLSGSTAPGRERERFQEPPAPLSQPAGPRISLPTTVAPPGADKITLTLNRVIVTGSTVDRPADFDPTYSEFIVTTRT